jgi:von Hippel-Lindau disease tumor supressor
MFLRYRAIAIITSLVLPSFMCAHAADNVLNKLSEGINNLPKNAQDLLKNEDKSKPQAADQGHGSANNANASTCATEKALKSWDGKTASTVRFVNASGKTLMTYWLNYKGKRVLYKTLAPGASEDQTTFVTHPWVVTTQDGACQGIYYPDAQLRVITLK